MDDLHFLKVSPQGSASFTILLPDGETSTITGLDLDIISQKCPLLAFSFEHRAFGPPHASIEASSRSLVVHFLRFLYLSDYDDQSDFGSEPGSLLRHAELLRMAEVFEVPELQALAHVNILLTMEISCSRPNPPDDLCSAISFVYAHLSAQRPLIESILHYCVSCFQYHNLGKNPAFRQLAFELRPFTNDLCRINYSRGFEDEGAMDIVCLPVSEPNPFSNTHNEQTVLGDFLFDLWADAPDFPEKNAFAMMRRNQLSESPSVSSRQPSPVFPRAASEAYSNYADTEGSETAASEVDGFTLVHRPKREVLDDFKDNGMAADSTIGFGTTRDETPTPRMDLTTATATTVTLRNGKSSKQSVLEAGEEDDSDSEWFVV